MTAPTDERSELTDEQTARAAAADHMIGLIEKLAEADKGSAMFIPQLAHDSYLAGYQAGRAKGLEEAAEMVTSNFSSWDDSTYQSANRLAQAIRAAAEGK